MGSYNIACQVTKTSIVPQQRVMVFFLVANIYDFENKYFNGNGGFPMQESATSCSGHFSVYGFPLRGYYDDYGRVVFDKCLVAEKQLELINSRLSPVDSDENTDDKYDRNKRKSTLSKYNNIEDAYESATAGGLRVNNHREITFITTMAIHESLYDDIIGKKKRRLTYANKNEFDHQELSALVHGLIQPQNWRGGDEKLMSLVPDLSLPHIRNPSITDEMLKIIMPTVVFDYFRLSGDLFNESASVLLGMGGEATLEEISALVSILYLGEWADVMNIMFIPTMLGKQEYNYTEQIEYMETILEFTKGLQAKIKDEDEDEDM